MDGKNLNKENDGHGFEFLSQTTGFVFVSQRPVEVSDEAKKKAIELIGAADIVEGLKVSTNSQDRRPMATLSQENNLANNLLKESTLTPTLINPRKRKRKSTAFKPPTVSNPELFNQIKRVSRGSVGSSTCTSCSPIGSTSWSPSTSISSQRIERWNRNNRSSTPSLNMSVSMASSIEDDEKSFMQDEESDAFLSSLNISDILNCSNN